ncbi:hypothetical protein HPP92_012825 [Vanilla planifolia]|uniref:J domain-containing protein n=1 Tax=Vanilla planifolia TaxID=51239 RepID=A0A835QNT5_VANPL|nr:hypothetical protein HPP92_012825 [Vanilla planifolia]
MGVDYYNILKVNRNATNEDLKKAYRRLAMVWHPDKHRNDKQAAETRFKQISEAYDILSDPQKRAIYDEFGEEGLKGMAPSGSRGATKCSTSSSVPSNFQFNPRNAEDIFAEAFQNDFESEYMNRSKSTRFQTDRTFNRQRSEYHHGSYGQSFNAQTESKDQRAPAIENKLACSLEELYVGSTRKIKISRNVIISNGRSISRPRDPHDRGEARMEEGNQNHLSNDGKRGSKHDPSRPGLRNR